MYNKLNELREVEQILYESCCNCYERNGCCVFIDNVMDCNLSQAMADNSKLIFELKSKKISNV